MYIVNMASSHTHQEASFLLDKDNALEEKIIHFLDEVIIFIIKFEKNKTKKPTTNQVLNVLKTCTVIWCNFKQFQILFFYLGFLTRTFMIHWTAEKEEVYFFDFFLQLLSTSQALTH